MTRRDLLLTLGASAAATGRPPKSGMGVAATCYLSYRKPRAALPFLEYCADLGAGGIQSPLGFTDSATARALRTRAEQEGMYFEAMLPLPKQDPTEFQRAMNLAREAGANVVRVGCLSGRRYETFRSMADWKKFVADSEASLKTAIPIAEKLKMPLAVENHKDWRAEEFVGLLRKHSNEYFRVCLDTGNNLSLLDDPYELVDALAPYTAATHIKDMAVAPHKDGFLLAEVPLGAGYLDMQRIIRTIRQSQPKVRFTLEMITRNPLVVPCLRDEYWTTFPELEGKRMARLLRQAGERKQPIPTVDALTPGAAAEWEDTNVRQCLHTAREQFGL